MAVEEIEIRTCKGNEDVPIWADEVVEGWYLSTLDETTIAQADLSDLRNILCRAWSMGHKAGIRTARRKLESDG